jgi:3-hydroxyisobutyrate dehydrogenase-like beta-hydroxyacid dehydrogenase
MNGQRIGFLGPGAMGSGMVKRLLEAGSTVTIWARTPAKVQHLVDAGATFAESPANVAEDSDIVLGCLLDSEVIRAIYLGSSHAEGLVHRARPTQIFVEHATFDPALAQTISEALNTRGASFLDAPVSGGPAGAEAGTLVSMIGGSPQTLERASTVLAAYCTRVKYAGATGSGLRLKLINQLLVSVHALAAAEASVLAIRHGIDGDTAREALMGGWAASAMLDLQMPKVFANDFSSGGATIGGLLEVQRLVAGMVSSAGTTSELLGPVRKVFEAVASSGHARDGFSSLAHHY